MSLIDSVSFHSRYSSHERRERERHEAVAVRRTLVSIDEEWQQQSDVLRGMLGADGRIDEMALLFPGDSTLASFVRYAVQSDGYTVFNSAHDHVTVGPLRTGYDVRYWFLTTPHYVPGKQGYRLELMTVQGGFSPLHTHLGDLIIREDDAPFCRSVHASFKCANEEDYATAVFTLNSSGYEMVQRCHSSYGRFSYWQPQDDPEIPAWLLKPRVNLRDSGQEEL